MGGSDDLWARLERRRILTSASVRAALRDIPPAAFVDSPFADVLPLDAPLPTSPTPPRAILPPPRLLAMLLQMLELEAGVSVLLIRSTGGYVEALLARLIEPAQVTVVEEDDGFAARARQALEATGNADRVEFVARPPDHRYDRVTTAAQIVRLDPSWKSCLADMGFAAYRSMRETHRFVKLLRSGDEFVELAASDAPLGSGPEPRRPTQVDLSRELLLGRMLENVWDRRLETDHERHFAEVVDETFAPAGTLPPTSSEEGARYDAAKTLFHLAYVYQSAGDFEAALDVYRASLAVKRTSESHTFLGWVLSFEGRYEEAIAECERAIEADPSLGNPYNDIGAYLIELERWDEAISWFERAKAAERYCCYFYPYANLARVYLQKGMHEKARRELQEAVRINPDYHYARDLLRRLERGSDYIA